MAIDANRISLAPPLQHDYHDYSVVPDEALGTSAEAALGSVQMANTQPSFPVKLHHMLEEVENGGFDDIVGWEVHGRCFKIHDHKQFVEKILPRFFRQTKYASFQRQLNLYEFRRLTIGQDRGAYYHEMFLRGRPGLAFRMRRTKYKGKGPRKPASPQSEPNFYHMPPVGDGDDEDKPQQQQLGRTEKTVPSHIELLQQQQQQQQHYLEQQAYMSPPQPQLASSISGNSFLSQDAQPSHNSVTTDSVSSLLDELLRASNPNYMNAVATPGPNTSGTTDSLNLASFLANQYRNRDIPGSFRGANAGKSINVFSA